jgi:hypothetical protein
MINGRIVGVNVNGNVYYKSTIYADWYLVQGKKLSWVSINEEGNLCGVDTDRNVWFKANANTGYWRSVPGELV